MDIRNFAVQPTGRLHLRNANDELMYDGGDKSKPVTVLIYGPGSVQHAKAQTAAHNRLVDKLRRKGKSEDTTEQLAQEKAEWLSGCTASFENLEYGNLTGNDLAMAVYSDITVGFIADQVTKFVGEWNNFLTVSTTS